MEEKTLHTIGWKKKLFSVLALMLALVMMMGTLPAMAADASFERLLKTVEPMGGGEVLAGQDVTLRALAHKEATVTARIGSTTVTLKQDSRAGGPYYWFTGSYKVPASAKAGQSLGEILFTAQKDGRTETRTTGSMTVAKLDGVTPSQPDDGGDGSSVKPQGGQQVIVTSDYADVFIPAENDRDEDYSAPYYYQLPKGTIDYVSTASSGSVNCLLASGRKVKYSDIKTYATSGSLGDNTISRVGVSADRSYTTLDISGKWSVPFNIEAQPYTYLNAGNTVSSFSPTKVMITFDYTTDIKTGSISFPSGSCFTSASTYTRVKNGISQGVLELTLREPGKYYGCYASYDSMGQLQLRFLNPVSSLEGARIVIDPGHGSYKNSTTLDVGAVANGLYEHKLNADKAAALATELRARGAEVYVLDTWESTDLYSLYARLDAAVAWEPHLYISVHHNSSSNTTARGIEVYYNTPWSMNLAKNVCNNIFGAYQQMDSGSTALNRGHKFSEFAVTRNKQFASILIEYGFITSPVEAAVLSDKSNLPLFASATADGIEAYLAGK